MRSADYIKPRTPDTVGWSRRHLDAVRNPRPGIEAPIVQMLKGWIEYADHFNSRNDTKFLADDYFLGPLWRDMGKALRGLLNGELGRLDAGTIDGIICHNLKEQGYDPDMI